jgi:hypothetical protein
MKELSMKVASHSITPRPVLREFLKRKGPAIDKTSQNPVRAEGVLLSLIPAIQKRVSPADYTVAPSCAPVCTLDGTLEFHLACNPQIPKVRRNDTALVLDLLS